MVRISGSSKRLAFSGFSFEIDLHDRIECLSREDSHELSFSDLPRAAYDERFSVWSYAPLRKKIESKAFHEIDYTIFT